MEVLRFLYKYSIFRNFLLLKFFFSFAAYMLQNQNYLLKSNLFSTVWSQNNELSDVRKSSES